MLKSLRKYNVAVEENINTLITSGELLIVIFKFNYLTRIQNTFANIKKREKYLFKKGLKIDLYAFYE